MPIPAAFSSPRAAILVVFAGFGFAVGALAGSMPTVTGAIGISDWGLGLAITCFSFANVATMVLSSRLSPYVSNRAVLRIALPLVSLFVFGTLLAPTPVLFGLAYMGLGVALGLLDLYMNAEGSAIEHDMRRPVFTAFHASVSSALMVMAIAASFLATTVGPWGPAALAAVMLGFGWLLTSQAVVPRKLAPRAREGAALHHRTALVLLGLIAGISIAGETAAILWSAKLLNAQAPQLAAIAGLGAAFFGLCNAAIRMIGDKLRGRFGDLPLMAASILVAIIGFLMVGLTSNFGASISGFALIGFGTAVLVPCAFTLAAAKVPENRAGGIAFVSLLAGGPRIAAPWAFGALTAATSLSFAFGTFAVVLGVALALLAWLARLE